MRVFGLLGGNINHSSRIISFGDLLVCMPFPFSFPFSFPFFDFLGFEKLS